MLSPASAVVFWCTEARGGGGRGASLAPLGSSGCARILRGSAGSEAEMRCGGVASSAEQVASGVVESCGFLHVGGNGGVGCSGVAHACVAQGGSLSDDSRSEAAAARPRRERARAGGASRWGCCGA